MRYRFVTAALSLALVACGESSNTTSVETCSTVALSRMRIEDAAGAQLGTPQEFSQALAIYRYDVIPGMRLTATLDVPDDKDYHMAFFDTQGNRLSCSDNAGKGVDESMEIDAGERTKVLVKVWTSEVPSTSSFSLLVTGVLTTEVAEQEPNNTPATAQVIASQADEINKVTGAVDSDAGDADDYFAYSVAPGDVFNVQANLTSAPEALVYVALRTAAGDPITVNGEDLFFSYDENATTASLTYTIPAGMNTILVWMSGIPGAASYEVITSIE